MVSDCRGKVSDTHCGGISLRSAEIASAGIVICACSSVLPQTKQTMRLDSARIARAAGCRVAEATVRNGLSAGEDRVRRRRSSAGVRFADIVAE